ncbi:MAG: hypothetical protein II088_08380, partial [Bacteroidales bacterium]|nr:hypothetical protein [Bacteroidales bacterium]
LSGPGAQALRSPLPRLGGANKNHKKCCTEDMKIEKYGKFGFSGDDYGRLLLSILTSVPHSNLFNAYKQIKALPCPSSKAEQASYKFQCKHIAQSSFNA